MCEFDDQAISIPAELTEHRSRACSKNYWLTGEYQRFDLRGRSVVTVPLTIDLAERRLRWIDVHVKDRGDLHQVGGYHAALAHVGKDFQDLVGTHARPTMWDLAAIHAAARANLEQILTPDAYAKLDALNERILRGCSEVIARYGLPGYAVGVGSKGCVTFSRAKILDYETFKANQDAELADLAWLFNMNRGIFMTPGREEEWTLSVAHDEEAVDAYVAVFDEMARQLTE